MATTSIEDQMAEINRKLDRVVQEMEHLQHARSAAEDLLADLTLVAKDAYRESMGICNTVELEPKDVVQLIKVGIGNVNLLTVALQQLESATDFLKDMQPITRDLYQQAIAQFQSLQERGYFNAAATGARIADTLVRSHSIKDLNQIEAGVPYLVGFMRELTHPEVLQALEAIIHGFGRVQATMNVDKSVFQIVRELNSPDARRGIGILVEFLKVVGARDIALGTDNT